MEKGINAGAVNRELNQRVIGCAVEVHRTLGPGLLESVYEQCLAHELSTSGIQFRTQHPAPVTYKNIQLECGYRVDFLVEHELILELKSVERLTDLHRAQLVSYLRASGLGSGLLLNFNATRLKDGLIRVVL